MEKQNIAPKQAKKMGLYENAKFPYEKEWEWNGDHYHVARYADDGLFNTPESISYLERP